MIKNFKLFLLFFPFFGIAQVVHPNEIRKNIYDIIVNEIKNNRKDYTYKVIQLDETINKFDNIEFTTLGIEFSQPIYSNDKSYCSQFVGIECVDKIAIDKFTLQKVYKEHKDKDYQDYYGIYAPIDSWYGVVTSVLRKALENKYSAQVEVIIPLKNVYFKDGKEVTENYFYQFKLDENLKIINYQKIKFSL